MSDTSDREKYEALKRSIADIGFIRSGSIVRRFNTCGKSGCRCHATPPTLHGPYYQLTRKVRGKTITEYLSEQEADLVAEWIKNGRKLERIRTQMQALALKITDRTLKQLEKSDVKR